MKAPDRLALGLSPTYDLQAAWPLHTKAVAPIKKDCLLALPMPPELKACLGEDLRWLSDPSFYTAVKSRPVRTATYFSAADVAAMLDTKKLVPAGPLPTRGTVNAFWVAEPKKTRRRPIFETLSNRELGRWTLREMRHISRQATHQQSRGGGVYALAFDFASFYDSLPLDEEIRSLFRLRIRGILYELNRLAMGQRQACQVAQSVCDAICAFDMPGVDLATYIDNVRFVSRCPHALAKAVRTFLSRVRAVGLDLNVTVGCKSPIGLAPSQFLNIDEWLALTDEEMAARAPADEEFLGSFYNYQNGTVCNTPSSLAKLKDVLSSGVYLSSRRRFAALMGLIIYMAATTSLPFAPYFCLLRFFRRTASAGAGTGWDLPIDPIPESAREDLHNLTNILLANVPLTITAPRPESGDYDKIIITDASAAGWGGLCFVPSTGTMVMHAAQWPKPLNHSAIAEPRGLRLACRRFISASTTDRILLISDHSPIAAVGARDNPYAKGFELNLLFLELLGYPAASFSYAHVAGHLNPTDALSRDFVTEHGQCWDGNLESLRLKFFNAA